MDKNKIVNEREIGKKIKFKINFNNLLDFLLNIF